MKSSKIKLCRTKSRKIKLPETKSPGINLSGMRLFGTFCFLLFTLCILTHSELSLYYAALGLTLWLEKMVPSLLPFMILSGIVIRLGLTEAIASFVYPLVRPIYRVRRNVCYCMMLGFLCGFPMGARVVSDLYSRGQLTREEGEYLLAFCNNIGPVYYCSFVLPLLHRELTAPYLFGMYGIPALYGLFLRHTRYRSLENLPCLKAAEAAASGELAACSHRRPYAKAQSGAPKGKLPKGSVLRGMRQSRDASGQSLLTQSPARREARHNHSTSGQSLVRRGERLLAETDQSVGAAIRSILTLGGYMILFNLLNLIPHVLWGQQVPLPAPLFEITGGLNMLQARAPLYSLLVLSFGGFSCIAQTYSCIRDTDLSIVDYTLHKIILTALSLLFYLSWLLLSPESFLR